MLKVSDGLVRQKCVSVRLLRRRCSKTEARISRMLMRRRLFLFALILLDRHVSHGVSSMY